VKLMAQKVALRLLLMVLLVAVANLGGYTYAFLARTISGNPFFAREVQTETLWSGYAGYVQGMLQGSYSDVAVYQDDFFLILGRAAVASGGLLLLAMAISIVLGLTVGLLGVRLHPPGIRGWLTGLTILGLSTPSFFIGRLAVALLLLAAIYARLGAIPLPIQGYGWNLHLVLPLLALCVRPTAQIAQVTAGLLAGELGRQYIVAARGKGLTERRVIWHHALRNVWAPVAQAVAGAMRLLVADLIVVEWLFAWPGLGFLMAATLIPAQVASASVEARFLDPPLVASLITIFAAVFLLTDLVAGTVARAVDPRQRA
jgi:peptide/nickel transport system permease protein